jgi:CheY-like chemotaxis protein
LPRRAEDAIVPQLELPRPSAPEGLGRSILLVEDDPEVQRVAVTMLKELHYQVYSASTADTALELLQQHPDIQLLFSDIMLHGQTDGVELARRAKERDRNLRVLLTSGFSEHAIGNQVGTTSDYLFISKPYMRDQLARTLSAAWNSGLQGQRPPH